MGEETLASIYDDMENLWRHLHKLEMGLEQTLSSIVADIERLDSEITSLTEIIQSMGIPKNFKASQDLLKDLNQRVQELWKIVGALPETVQLIETLDKRLKENMENYDRLNKKISELEGSIDRKLEEQTNKRNAELEARIDKLEKRMDALFGQLGIEIDMLRDKIETLKSQNLLILDDEPKKDEEIRKIAEEVSGKEGAGILKKLLKGGGKK